MVVYQLNAFDAPTSRFARPGEFRVGLTTSDCPRTLFDEFHTGPIELMKAAASNLPAAAAALSFFKLASNTAINVVADGGVWRPCESADTFLERQHLCKKLFKYDPVLSGKCSANFCSSCTSQKQTAPHKLPHLIVDFSSLRVITQLPFCSL